MTTREILSKLDSLWSQIIHADAASEVHALLTSQIEELERELDERGL